MNLVLNLCAIAGYAAMYVLCAGLRLLVRSLLRVYRALFVCIFTVVLMATNAANADIGRFDLKRAGSRSIVQTIHIAVAVPLAPIPAHGHISRVWPDRGLRYRLWHAVISLSNCGADLAKGLVRINPARRAPTDELGDIDPAVPDFTLVDPRLGRAEFFGQIALRELCFLTDGAQERREVSVSWLMLALWHPSTIAARPLDSD